MNIKPLWHRMLRWLTIIALLIGLFVLSILSAASKDHPIIIVVLLVLLTLAAMVYAGVKLWHRRQAQQRMVQAWTALCLEIAKGQHQGRYDKPGLVSSWDFAGRAQVDLPSATQFLKRYAQSPAYYDMGDDWPYFDLLMSQDTLSQP